MNDSTDSEFKRLFGDARSIKNDRVNLLADRQRQKKSSSKTSTPSFDSNQQNRIKHSATTSDSYFNSGIQKKLQARIRAGDIRPEAELDLHGLRAAEAERELDRFITQSIKGLHRMLLVVHGQGYGSAQQPVLKPLVFRQLAGYPQVLAWCPAQPRDGAGGATYVYLKQK